MSDSLFLNPVEFKIGDVVRLDHDAHTALRALFKINKNLNLSDTYTIVNVRNTLGRDYDTDLDDATIGATVLKNNRTGVELDINDIYLDEQDDHWAFFSNYTPSRFIKVFKENL